MELLRYFVVTCLVLYADAKKFRHYGYEFDEDANVWFKLHRLKATWYDARDICHQESAILASPDNNLMKDALGSYSSSYNIDQIFVGIHATLVKGWWNTLEGISIEELMHLDISQINSDIDQCSALNAGTLISVNCSESYPYMCYKRENSQQLTSCGTTDIEYKLNERTGSCYKFHENNVNWFEALKICSQEQAYLAIITSDDEKQVVKDIFQNYHSRILPYAPYTNVPYADVINIGFIDRKGNLKLRAIHESFNHSSEIPSTQLYIDPYRLRERIDRVPIENIHCGAITRGGVVVPVSCSAHIAFLCEKKVRNMNSSEETIGEKSSRTTKIIPKSQSHTLLNAIINDEYLRK